MFEPIYKKSRLMMGSPDSGTAIVSLWTKAKKVAEKIPRENYAVIGQLFSAERGLDLLVRNLLANPDITNLIITGVDFSRSGVVLKDFFERGFERGRTELTNREVWRVSSEIPGYIELDIPQEALENLRESMNVSWAEDIGSFDFSSLQRPYKTREKRIFEKPVKEAKIYPGEDSVYVVRHEKVAGVWLQVLDTILRFGRRHSTHYDDEQKEILNMVSVITGEDPENFHMPDFLTCSKEQILEYIPKVTTDFREEGTSYTYGSRMRSWFGQDQVKEAAAKLSRELNSRAVVVDLWDSLKDLTIGGSPCINHIWLRVRDDTLYMTATIRSNDMFEAYPENAFGLRALQYIVRNNLVNLLKERGEERDIKLGSLIINSQSAHIYDDCFESAAKIVNDNISNYVPEPSLRLDPRGNFQIELENGRIVVNHLSPGGEFLHRYSGTNALELRDKLLLEDLFGNTPHALYMGTELAKAEFALNNGMEYVQDQPLRTSLSMQPQITEKEREIIAREVVTTPRKTIQPLPSHGRLVSIRKIPRSSQIMLTYLVNDREFPIQTIQNEEEEGFRNFLKEHGMSRIF